MREIVEGVWLLDGFPRYLFNVYLVGGVLIDAATRWARGRILRQLRGRDVRLVALTHCHPDHQGAARAVCRQLKVPLACHELDAPAMEGRESMWPRNGIIRLGQFVWAGPPHPVQQQLREGDEIAGWRVIHAPGHTPGHVCYFREADRVAIVGDLLANINLITGQTGLGEPPFFFSVDVPQHRQSILKLVQLRPRVVCFGHGPPLLQGAELEAYVERWRAQAVWVPSPATL